MEKRWAALLVLVMGLSFSGMALAQGTPGGKVAEPAKPMAPAGKPAEKPADKPGETSAEKPEMGKEATGKVVSLNTGNKTMVVEANGKRMTFTVSEAAAKELSKFKRGDQVMVRYTEEGGKLLAQEISKG